MNDLINFLMRFTYLTPQQVELIESHAQIRKMNAEEYFSKAGSIANEIAFVRSGIFRIVFYNKEGIEITRYFVDENHFLVDLNSYTYQVPCTEYMQAITDAELIVFGRSALQQIENTIVGWDKVVARITTNSFLEKVNRIAPMMSEDATTRYLCFLEDYPQLANRIPLSFLASYIGVTQQSLSRIRRSVK